MGAAANAVRRNRPGRPAAVSSRSGLQGALAPLAEAAEEEGVAVYLVGGAVRDLLLARPFVDVDVAVEAEPGEVPRLAGRLADATGWALHAAHERFGTATLDAGALRVDLAATRKESYPIPGALPVVEGRAPLAEDLARRDFTIQAMARRIESRGRLGELIDPHSGKQDLVRRVLRLLHDRSLADDPTRALRAVRYAARLGFRLEDRFGSRLATSREAGSWARVSGDRLRRGLAEVLAEPDQETAIGLLHRHGLLGLIAAGWDEHPADPRAIESADGEEARWAALLAPLPEQLRAVAAARLGFPRTHRGVTGT